MRRYLVSDRKPIVIRDELNIDENLCRAALERLRDEGKIESTGKMYLIRTTPAEVSAPLPVYETSAVVPNRPPPADDRTEKALALVRVDNGKLITDSLMVAEVFGKDHANVLKAIDNLDCSQEFGRVNFNASNYLNSQGKECRRALMTRDGFCYLVMGFTGAEAAKWRSIGRRYHGRTFQPQRLGDGRR